MPADEASLESKMRECPISSEDQVVAILTLQGHMDATEEHPDLKIDFISGLRKGEKQFQKSQEFQSGMVKVETARALDNAQCSAIGPFYKPAQKLQGVGEAVYEKTAMIDVTSTAAPMDLEMKGTLNDPPGLNNIAHNDWAVLKQATERTRVRLFLAAYLSVTVAFAVTNRQAWCLIGRRYFEGKEVRVDLLFWRINHASITRLWMGVTRKAAEVPNFFLTPDGSILCHALCKIGVAPWSCRVNILGVSQSVVYGVSLPIASLSIDATKIRYAVKVVREDYENYSRERDALKAIALVDPSTYAIGYVNQGGEAATFGLSIPWEKGEPIAAPKGEGDRWWWNLSKTNGNEEGGGAIFMKYGRVPREGDDRSKICLGVCKSLQFAHEAGILHCDIRKSNILFFEGVGWRLVDFGLCCKNDESPYDLTADSGAQAEGVGPRVKTCLENKQPFYWRVGDDYEMQMQLFRLFDEEIL